MSLTNPVRSLNPEVARKIAAGEVIDRPNAIVRELLDNAIDSGAKNITVEISGGGIEKIRIVDDGCGMTKDDLQNCARPHATSKISTETDLMKLSTLGFRGEALASIAAVSRLSITSGNWKMRASITEDHILEPVADITGTIVQSEGLFENFPARRQFLKRVATEGVMCKNTFIEKAMACPEIAFRLIQDGEIKLDLPANQTLTERFISANSYNDSKDLFFQLSKKSDYKTEDKENWTVEIIIGEPAVSRTNKKDIFIYANGRRIQEFGLIQAVEYGGQGFFPNGTYPVAVVFITVNPSLIDFNIHPAKKEARFYDISEIHHGISSTIKSFLQGYTFSNFRNDKPTDEINSDYQLPFETSFNSSNKSNTADSTYITPTSAVSDKTSSYEKHISYKTPQTGEKSFSDFRSKYLSSNSFETKSKNYYERQQEISDLAKESLFEQIEQSRGLTETSKKENTSVLQNVREENHTESVNTVSIQKEKIRYVGNCLGTFLLAEKNNCLYMIDQHAVHERILFNKIMESQGNNQKLLIPYKIKTESKTQDNQLEKLKPELDRIGFTTEKVSEGNWEISSIPERWTGSQYDLQTLLFTKQVEPKEIIRSIAAMTACKAAVKDGYVLDEVASARLVEQAFTLDDPHCPHGRPVYTVISREKLFELVKRT